MKRYLVAIGLCGVTAACTAPTTVQDNQWRSGVPSSFQYAAIGPVPTVVVGNPFAIPDADIAQLIAQASAGTYGGSLASFVPSSATTGSRVVWDLSPDVGQTGQALCALPLRPATTRTPATNRVMGAFCSGFMALADATVRLEHAPTGPDNPEWRRAFPIGLMAMIPRFDPYEDLE